MKAPRSFRRQGARGDEQGMALLTTLMLVAVMAALAVGVLDDIRFGVRRTANANSVGQAQWYALGAEQLARARIAQLWRADPGRTTLAGGWEGRPFIFPIEGGVIRGSVQDAQSCFDLNGLVQGRSDLWFDDQPDAQAAARQLVVLLTALGSSQGEAMALTGAITDWMDTDLDVNGGEDEAYVRRRTPYRTAEQPFWEVSELRAVEGVTPELYARLRPYVCASPPPPPGTPPRPPRRINVNTLHIEDAVLLTALTGGRLSPAEAARVIASRPVEGWRGPPAFWAHPTLADLLARSDATEAQALQAMVDVKTRVFALQAEVDYNGAEVVMTSVFEQGDDGRVVLRARRWTLDE